MLFHLQHKFGICIKQNNLTSALFWYLIYFYFLVELDEIRAITLCIICSADVPEKWLVFSVWSLSLHLSHISFHILGRS